MLLFAMRLTAARLLGYRIVWTIHQLAPHESAVERVDRAASTLLARAAHVVLAHDRATIRAASSTLRLPDGRISLIPHGSYIGVYAAGRAVPAVRADLEIPDDAFVFLSLGLIRAYKDIDVLLEAFAAVADPGAVLIVAGSPVDENVSAAIEAAAARDRRIKPILEFVPDGRLAELYGASDAAVIARGDGGTSGALILALSFGVPAVAARTETYSELLGHGAAGWLFESGSSVSLGETLSVAAADRPGARVKGAAAKARAEALQWPAIAAQFAALVLGTQAGAPSGQRADASRTRG
jgi:glycosyltransferase involved in cell wall biosynthesis